MKLTALGTGSPEAYPRRASSGYLVEVGEARILLDCGGGVFDRLLAAGHRPSDITHIVFSHLHSDHMMDYARLVHAAWDEGAAPVRVFGPQPIAAITAGYFGADGVLAHDLRARTELPQSQQTWVARGGSLPRPWPAPEVREVMAADVLRIGAATIRFCVVEHAAPLLDCHAISVEADGRRLVYSGDAGASAEFARFCAGADVLIHWCYRLCGEPGSPEMRQSAPDPTTIGAMARKAGVGALYLTHLRAATDTDTNRAAALAAMQAAFGARCAILEDLDAMEI